VFEIRPRLDDLAQEACVGVQQRLAVDVNDGDIVDVPPVAGNRLQQVVEIDVVCTYSVSARFRATGSLVSMLVLSKSGTALLAA
jgi:hypothetical protein